MRTVGRRKIRPLSAKPSGELLKQGALFNDELHKLPTGTVLRMPKGVYRYRSHEEANAHWEACLIAGIVDHAER